MKQLVPAGVKDRMRRLARTTVRRLMRAAGLQGEFRELRGHIVSTHQEVQAVLASVSAFQREVREMRQDLKDLVRGAATDGGRFPSLAGELDAAASRCLSAARTAEKQDEELRTLATHYTKSATLVSRDWLQQHQRMMEPYFDDDGTVEYAIRRAISVPGSEVEVDANRPVVPWRHLFTDGEAGVFLVLGGSNAANHGELAYTAREDVSSFDFLRGQCYLAADPLPGASGIGGSVWSRLGDLLVGRGVFRSVLFVPVAFGDSYITDWIPSGRRHGRTGLALSRLRRGVGKQLLSFSGVLWQQGEAEANHTRMSETVYRMHFYDIVADLRANGVFAPIFIARATLCEAGEHPHRNQDAIRMAQTCLANPTQGILPGPDTDVIGLNERTDGYHLSAQGLERCAELWFDAIAERRNLLTIRA